MKKEQTLGLLVLGSVVVFLITLSAVLPGPRVGFSNDSSTQASSTKNQEDSNKRRIKSQGQKHKSALVARSKQKGDDTTVIDPTIGKPLLNYVNAKKSNRGSNGLLDKKVASMAKELRQRQSSSLLKASSNRQQLVNVPIRKSSPFLGTRGRGRYSLSGNLFSLILSILEMLLKPREESSPIVKGTN